MMRASNRNPLNRPDVRLTASAGASSFVDRRKAVQGPRRSARRSLTNRAARSPRGHGHFSPLDLKHALRREALRDCGHRCAYCATPLRLETATLDHVMPRSLGGANESGNLVAACALCNRLKGDQLPFEFFTRHPWAGENFVRQARTVHRALKRGARRAISLAFARTQDAFAA
ncbi:MAG TPA: HNH endonuclease [Gemmatimonas aurantiaca]|nr:HNH endonuclease [Gemmatimonas aurantiaca]HCT58152.1 HNH endonuclease [Gemmatimonas aurantiaca]